MKFLPRNGGQWRMGSDPNASVANKIVANRCVGCNGLYNGQEIETIPRRPGQRGRTTGRRSFPTSLWTAAGASFGLPARPGTGTRLIRDAGFLPKQRGTLYPLYFVSWDYRNSIRRIAPKNLMSDGGNQGALSPPSGRVLRPGTARKSRGCSPDRRGHSTAGDLSNRVVSLRL